MGKASPGLKPFTKENVADKELVIKMLNYEDLIAKSDIGKNLYADPTNGALVTLNVEKILNRLTLTEFGFSTRDSDVETYRTIFATYYRSPTDFDADVLNAVYYMRENKCVYYQQPALKISDLIPDCPLYELNGATATTLFEVINKKPSKFTLIGAFSLS